MNILGVAFGAKSQINLVGAPSFAQVNPYGLYNHFKSDEYASHYPNVRPITNELMGIIPHAIDRNGKPVSHAVLDALYHPNKRDSLPMFMEKLGVSVLAQDYTYLLVWRNEGGRAIPGGDFGFKGNNIAGFTFLECPGVEYRDGKIYYKIGAQEFSEDEVIAIPGSARPGRLYEGYSPAMSAAKWASLDGHIADFQNGFFENNAIPAGVFKVAAPTTQEYKDMVTLLKERHHGAGNNNNVSYTHVPIDEQGKQAPAQIEWIPFAQSNKDIDFKPLLDHVDNRLSESYGVSSIIKGVDSAAKYSNAEVSEAGFAKRAVKPLALRIYSQITHELNRITGGLGAAITFKYEIPAVSDAEKVKAETKREEVAMIKELTGLGYSLDSAVDALQLSQSYKLLKLGAGAAVIDNDKPEVDEGDEVGGSPNPDLIDGVTPIDVIKPIVSKSESADPTVDAQLVPFETHIELLLRDQIDKQAKRTPLNVSDVANDATDEENDTLADEILAILLALMLLRGQETYQATITNARDNGIDTSTSSSYATSITDEDKKYMRDSVSSFNKDTLNEINVAITAATAVGATEGEIRNMLNSFSSNQVYRINRFAQNESWRASEKASLAAAIQLNDELNSVQNVSTYKTWSIQTTACPICIDYAGVTVKVNDSFFGGINEPPAHVTCRCILTFSVRKDEATQSLHRELHCSACDRFLGITESESYTDKLKCSNSACKSLSIPVIREVSDGDK